MTTEKYETPVTDSDSDPDLTDSQFLRHGDLSNSIFQTYLETTNQSSSSSITAVDLSKIRSFLSSSSSGALSCLICLERIRPSDPTWSCSSLCYAVFHLLCIQSWARQSSDLSALRAATRLPISADKASESSAWNCPKCRSEYSKAGIPKTYYCFCGNVENPPSDNPWILPHSCGEVCNRSLRHNCGHFCLLLCHPGPCPSCPKLIKSKCYCGSVEEVRRCGLKDFSCNEVCNKSLDCKIHHCSEICHNGPCPPCHKKGVYQCRCRKTKEERECFERDFRCENACERLLGCSKHRCDKGCHEGECGDCLLQGRRTCPCGKRIYDGMACDVQVPLCGATCGKLLGCGIHRCSERCHRGPCIETCRVVVWKSCRCGGLKKEVPCHQVLSCERKCQRLRDCGRHACRRKCCDGYCPPCSEICDKRLRCKNHKCPSPCHRGPCSPCPMMVSILCACGQTHFEVPCGTELDQKPPRCPKLCSTTPLCRHASTSKPHKCHYGPCPTCRRICEQEYPCGHQCKLRCHGPKPPPKPEFTVKPKKKKSIYQNECTPGSACPPCPELVWRACVGHHVGMEKMIVCSDRIKFSCENLCGNPLPCGNHYCTKTCHELKSPSSASVQHQRSQSCDECILQCQKERQPSCPHPCPKFCHPEDCPPCKVLVKRSCHCGTMVHVFECLYFNTLSKNEQVSVRSCGGPCHRKLPNCTHLCPKTCHPGDCPLPDKCSKKVTIRCKCQTLKKEQLCQDVQAAYHRAGSDPKGISRNQFGLGLLPCNSDCKSKVVEVVDSELTLRRSKPLEETEAIVEKHAHKRKRRREQKVEETKQVTRLEMIVSVVRRLLLITTVIVGIMTVSYYGYKGLFKLSDWMNQVDEQRKRMRPPRF